MNRAYGQTKKVGVLLCKLRDIVSELTTLFGLAGVIDILEIFGKTWEVRDNKGVSECLLDYRYVVSNTLEELLLCDCFLIGA